MVRNNWKKALGLIIVAGIAVFILIQLIPVDKSNPKVVSEPNWAAAPGTRELAKVACFDCHSNETKWPWYAKLAPSSWLLSHDVTEGRETMNFSDWNNNEMEEVDEIAEVIDEGEMPPWYYVMMHPDAKLSNSEKQQLINGLEMILSQPAAGG